LQTSALPLGYAAAFERIKDKGERIKLKQASYFILSPFAFILSKFGAGNET
jgi:hypothetical protein